MPGPGTLPRRRGHLISRPGPYRRRQGPGGDGPDRAGAWATLAPDRGDSGSYRTERSQRSKTSAICNFNYLTLRTSGTTHFRPSRRIAPTRLRSRTVSPDFTPREREVLAALALGLSSKQIAAKLGVADRTVQVHVARLMAKAKANNRTHLAVKAITMGWIDPPAAADLTSEDPA